jgi:ABC-type uncharacterized transport system involved in gliding motility auxiliary subunit
MATDKKKKRVYASNALLYAFFVVATVALVNLISTRVFGRLDLTENKVYTLSKSSKDLVKSLPDYMSVKAFMSSDLPPELKTVSRYVRDLIDEYKSSSNGKLRWEAIDPGTDQKLEEEASRCKVQKLQIQVMRSQKFELGAYYLGLCLEYGSEVESIPQVMRPEGLEYQLSSLIKKMTTKKKKIAFTTGHGESDLNMGFQSLKEDLQSEFEVTTVNPSSAEIGADVDALIIGGPKQPIDEKGQKEIDKFIMQGKGAVFLIDGMAMQSPGGMGSMGGMGELKMGQANDTGLGKLLQAYGFMINQDFVFDRQSVPGPIDAGGRRMLASLPFFVGADVEEASDLVVLAGIRGVVFPFPSSVALTGPLADGKPKEGKLWRLAASSKQSWKHTGFFVLNPGTKVEEGSEKASYPLGYAYLGPLNSAFASAPATQVSDPAAPASQSTKPVRLVVVGDSDFANDEYVQLARFLPHYGAGAQLLFNAISWTVEDEALAPLRGKTMTPRPIQIQSEAAAVALQWGNIVGLPLAFCLFGLVRWRVRRATRLGQTL